MEPRTLKGEPFELRPRNFRPDTAAAMRALEGPAAWARLPMDQRTRDFVRVNGRRHERRPLDADWILERFPASGD